MGLQFVRTTVETAYAVFPTTPGMGTQLDLFLTSDNDMTVRAQPQFSPIRDAGVGNRLIRMIPGRTLVNGKFDSYLFPSQAAYILNLAAGLTGTAPCIDLPSFTIDHLIDRDFDCGKEYRRYLGCKIGKLSLKSDMSESGWLWSFDADVVASKPATITGTDFPTPALSAYPADDPFQFFQTAGNVSINGSVRSNYQSLGVDIDNVILPFSDEHIYPSSVTWFGRTVTFTIKLRYKSPADRLLYEAGTKMAASIEIDTGTHTLTMNFGGQTLITACTDALPMGGYFTQTLAFTALMDPSLGTPTDFSATVT